jgi:hypothetical protein
MFEGERVDYEFILICYTLSVPKCKKKKSHLLRKIKCDNLKYDYLGPFDGQDMIKTGYDTELDNDRI